MPDSGSSGVVVLDRRGLAPQVGIDNPHHVRADLIHRPVRVDLRQAVDWRKLFVLLGHAGKRLDGFLPLSFPRPGRVDFEKEGDVPWTRHARQESFHGPMAWPERPQLDDHIDGVSIDHDNGAPPALSPEASLKSAGDHDRYQTEQ